MHESLQSAVWLMHQPCLALKDNLLIVFHIVHKELMMKSTRRWWFFCFYIHQSACKIQSTHPHSPIFHAFFFHFTVKTMQNQPNCTHSNVYLQTP